LYVAGYASEYLAGPDADALRLPWQAVAMAQDWHGGQSTMLYALASTGALRCGRRHDPELLASLCDALASEWSDVARDESTDGAQRAATAFADAARYATHVLDPDEYEPIGADAMVAMVETLCELVVSDWDPRSDDEMIGGDR
jgi:hypothetical protein